MTNIKLKLNTAKLKDPKLRRQIKRLKRWADRVSFRNSDAAPARPKRRCHRKSRSTPHKAALRNPQVLELLRQLRSDWSKLNYVERGDRLWVLAWLGCSTRGVGKAIRRSATTIRRCMTIAVQTPEIREAVEQGLSTKMVLANVTADRKANWHLNRIALDRETGRLSDQVADDIMYFCLTAGENRVPLFQGEFQLFLSGVETYLLQFEQSGRKPLRVSKKRGRGALMRDTRPEPDEQGFWFDDQMRWVTQMVWSKTTERPIWQEAVRKARKREGELAPKPGTPRDAYLRLRERLERVHLLTPRPLFPGGARVWMERQGAKRDS